MVDSPLTSCEVFSMTSQNCTSQLLWEIAMVFPPHLHLTIPWILPQPYSSSLSVHLFNNPPGFLYTFR
eukprot:Gb_22923 [translate_table: standard]